MDKPTIIIFVMVDGREHVIETYPNEYPSLMMLIYDKIYLDNFGDCKGIGRCGTCHIRVLTPDIPVPAHQRNERTTLDKMEATYEDSRLACQILLTPALSGLRVEILNNENPGLY